MSCMCGCIVGANNSVPSGSQELSELIHKLIALGMNHYLVKKFWNEKLILLTIQYTDLTTQSILF